MRTAEQFLAQDREKKSLIHSMLEKETLGPRLVFDAARAEDELALRIVDEIGRITAVGIGSLINIFDPEMVIIGGGIAEAGSIYLNAIKKHIEEWTLEDSLEGVRLVLAKLGSRAGIFGAAALVFRNINRYMK
jgi:glucokinase